LIDNTRVRKNAASLGVGRVRSYIDTYNLHKLSIFTSAIYDS